MRIERRFTKAERDAYEAIEFRRTSSEIRNPDGSIVFSAEDISVPAAWSQVASDVLAQKYFRKRGLPRKRRRVAEEDVPEWLWRSEADDTGNDDPSPEENIPKHDRLQFHQGNELHRFRRRSLRHNPNQVLPVLG